MDDLRKLPIFIKSVASVIWANLQADCIIDGMAKGSSHITDRYHPSIKEINKLLIGDRYMVFIKSINSVDQ